MKGVIDLDDNVINLGAKVDSQLKKDFKAACAKQGKTMSDVTEDLIRNWLGGMDYDVGSD